jgi:hypothetical protein
MLDPDEGVLRLAHPYELVELHLDRGRIAVLRVLNQKHLRKVTMVVPVLMTSCQVSEKWNTGPVSPHTRMMAQARTNTQGRPASRDVIWATSEKIRLSACSIERLMAS